MSFLGFQQLHLAGVGKGLRRKVVVCQREDEDRAKVGRVAVREVMYTKEEKPGKAGGRTSVVKNVEKEIEFVGADDELTRLYSSVNPEEGLNEYKKSSIFGAIALVAGTTIGAGILALPAVTKEGGFVPSSALLISAWVYMSTTGNLIAEAAVATMWSTGRKDVSLLSMVEASLGKTGAIASGITYVFIHYALLVAYISQGGQVLDELLQSVNQTLPYGTPQVLFAGAIASLMYFGDKKIVENVNTTLVVILISTFGLLLSTILPRVDVQNFVQMDVGEAVKAIPVMILALVFHNIVPVICSTMDGDLKRVRTAVNVGSAIPLCMFLLWNSAVLGTVPLDAAAFDPVEILRTSGGGAAKIVSSFSILAITTSMFGFVYGLFDFIRDSKRRISGSEGMDNSDKDALYLVTFAPPVALALIAPGLFFKALDSAGTYGISVLFGIIPAAMVWKLRYDKKNSFSTPLQPLVAGGRWTLGLIAGCAIALIGTEAFESLSPLFHNLV